MAVTHTKRGIFLLFFTIMQTCVWLLCNDGNRNHDQLEPTMTQVHRIYAPKKTWLVRHSERVHILICPLHATYLVAIKEGHTIHMVKSATNRANEQAVQTVRPNSSSRSSAGPDGSDEQVCAILVVGPMGFMFSSLQGPLFSLCTAVQTSGKAFACVSSVSRNRSGKVRRGL